MQAFNSKEVELVKQLRPMKSSKTLPGGAKLNLLTVCYLFHQPNQLSGQKCIILNHILDLRSLK